MRLLERPSLGGTWCTPAESCESAAVGPRRQCRPHRAHAFSCAGLYLQTASGPTVGQSIGPRCSCRSLATLIGEAPVVTAYGLDGGKNLDCRDSRSRLMRALKALERYP